MSTHYGPNFNTIGIPDIYVDVWNSNNDSVLDVSLNRNIFTTSGNDMIVMNDFRTRCISFANSQKCTSTTMNATTSNVREFTRLAWFKLRSLAPTGHWSPLICNSIENTSDMCLAVDSYGKLHFHQYTRTGTTRTTNGDYGVSGDSNLSLSTWYFGAVAVSRTSNYAKFYLDGKPDGAPSIVQIGQSYSEQIILGGAFTDDYSGARFFNGFANQFMHYNRVLSDNEVNFIFSMFKGRYGK